MRLRAVVTAAALIASLLCAANRAHAAAIHVFTQGNVTYNASGNSSSLNYYSDQSPALAAYPDSNGVVGLYYSGSAPGLTEYTAGTSTSPHVNQLGQTVAESGFVNVSMSAGAIRADADGLSAGYGGAQSTGEFKDQVVFHNASGATAAIGVIYRIESQGVAVGPSGSASANGSLNFQKITGPAGNYDNSYVGNVVKFSHSEDPNPNDFVNTMTYDPNESPVTVTGANGTTGGTAVIHINLAPGDTTFGVDDLFSVNAGGAYAHYHDTAALNFDLPNGVTFSSTALFVPEPTSLALLAATTLLTLRRSRRSQR